MRKIDWKVWGQPLFSVIIAILVTVMFVYKQTYVGSFSSGFCIAIAILSVAIGIARKNGDLK